MARNHYTAEFPAASPGDEVTWASSARVYLDANSQQVVAAAYLNESRRVSLYTDASSLAVTCGEETLTLTTGSPSQSGADPAPSGGSGAATRDQYWTASRTTVTSGDYINLPFVEQAGHHHDHLLDLTDPTLPTAIADGVYAVTAMVDAGAVTAGKAFFVELDIDSNGDDAIATAVGDLGHDAGNGRPQATVSATFFCPAGGVISVLVSHDKGADETFRLTAAVQRLS